MAQPPPRRWQSSNPSIPDAEKTIKVPLDALLNPFTPALTPAQQGQFQQEFQAYRQATCPTLVWNRAVDRLAVLAFPDLPLTAAHTRIGYEAIRTGTSSAIISRILAAPLRVMSPTRLLQYFPKLYSYASNYGTCTTWEQAPQQWAIEVEDELLYPDYLCGNIDAFGRELIRVPSWRVSGTVQGPCHYLLTITW